MNSVRLTAFLCLLAAPAAAQDHSGHAMPGMSGGAMPGYMAAMDKMTASMAGMASAGDADADFLLMMIPHHQSAIDMAQVEIEQGDDPETKAMAEQIIAAQEKEIAEMKAMLARMGVTPPN